MGGPVLVALAVELDQPGAVEEHVGHRFPMTAGHDDGVWSESVDAASEAFGVEVEVEAAATIP